METKTSSVERRDIVAALVGFGLVALVVVLFVAKRSFSDTDTESGATGETAEEIGVSVPEISAEKALQRTLSTNPPRILDLRSSSSFSAFHIPDSANMTPEAIPDLPFGDAGDVLLVGDDPDIIREASRLLAARNIAHFAVSGDLPAWEAAGGALVHYGDPTSVTDLSKVTLVTPEMFRTLFSDSSDAPLLLDVRTGGDSLSDDALRIPLDTLERRRSEIPKATPIALCGTDGVEAFQAAVRLFDLGFLSITTLDGACSDAFPSSSES